MLNFHPLIPNARENYGALLEQVWGKGEKSPLEEVDDAQLRTVIDRVEEVLSALDPRTEEVFRLRYGLSDGRRRTQAAVGRELGLSRTRIGQIEHKGIRRLRMVAVSRRLWLAVFPPLDTPPPLDPRPSMFDDLFNKFFPQS